MILTIELPNGLYADLAELTRHCTGYTPAKYAEEIVCSELAARRVVHMPGRDETKHTTVEYRIALPQKRV